MTTAATTLLGLGLPVTGELSGTWGDVVNNSITNLLDTAIAGTTTISADADITLTTTTLASNQARQAVILWTAGGTVTRVITAPAQSKSYVVINATSSSQSIKLVGVGPTTGITIVAGEKCFAAWNGSDFVKVGNTSGAGVFSTVTASSLTSGRVTYAGTAGLLQDSANLLYSGTDLTVYGVKVGRGGGAVSTNTAVGASALAANTTGDINVAVGYLALAANTSGRQCVAVGKSALAVNNGDLNVAIGESTLSANTSGTQNTGCGSRTLTNVVTGSYNSALGYSALNANTGSYNVGVGVGALALTTTASGNTAVGYQALRQSNRVADTNAYNLGVGYQAGEGLTTGQYNTFVGGSAPGWQVTSGSKNVIIGNYSGGAAPISVTGSNFVVLSDGDGNIVASSKTAQTFALQGGTLSAGTGIAFPATQSASTDANTLDDYEEGSWTPGQGSGLTVVGTFSSAGRYVKIGRVVTITGHVKATTSVAFLAANAIIANNLPFSSNDGGGLLPSNGVGVNDAATANSVFAVSSTNMYSDGAMSATPAYYFSVTYFYSI